MNNFDLGIFPELATKKNLKFLYTPLFGLGTIPSSFPVFGLRIGISDFEDKKHGLYHLFAETFSIVLCRDDVLLAVKRMMG